MALYSVAAWALGWSYSEEFGWNRAMGTFENWNLLGGFDEDMWMYLEDVDLAFRSRLLGLRTVFAATAHIPTDIRPIYPDRI